MTRKYLKCSQCDIDLDPECFETSRYYDIGGEIYCDDCFKEWVKEYLDSNPEDIAKLMNVPVWDVM